MKRASSVPYLQVVPQDGTIPDFTPPCPPTVDPTDWQVLWHSDAIHAGEYDYWCAHGGPFVSDAALKAQGVLPPDWNRAAELSQSLFGPLAMPQPRADSTAPASPATDSEQSVRAPERERPPVQ